MKRSEMKKRQNEQNVVVKRIVGAILSVFGSFCVFLGSGGVLLDLTGNAKSISGFLNDMVFIALAACFLSVGLNFFFGPGRKRAKMIGAGAVSLIAFLVMFIYFGPFALKLY